VTTTTDAGAGVGVTATMALETADKILRNMEVVDVEVITIMIREIASKSMSKTPSSQESTVPWQSMNCHRRAPDTKIPLFVGRELMNTQ
jgi:hypothetical protein